MNCEFSCEFFFCSCHYYIKSTCIVYRRNIEPFYSIPMLFQVPISTIQGGQKKVDKLIT